MDSNTQTITKSEKNLRLAKLIALIGAIILTATLFLPYSTAIGERAEMIKQYPDSVVYEELNITAKDMKNISMVEYARIYNSLSNQLWGDSDSGTFYVVIVSLIGGFAALTVLFAYFKKPILIMLFTVFAFGTFYIQNLDYTMRGIIPNQSFTWGAAYYIFYGASIVVFGSAIWLLICKIRSKKAAKLSPTEASE